MGKKKQIIYSKDLEVEKKENFISTKLGREILAFKEKLENMPSAIKWILAVLLGGVISSIVGIVISTYLGFGVTTIEQANTVLKIQLLIDIMIISMMAIFIWLVLREAE